MAPRYSSFGAATVHEELTIQDYYIAGSLASRRSATVYIFRARDRLTSGISRGTAPAEISSIILVR